MSPSQKRPLIPPNPVIDDYGLRGVLVVYVSLLVSLWLLTDFPLTVYSVLWLAGLVVCGCALLVGVRYLWRVRLHSRLRR